MFHESQFLTETCILIFIGVFFYYVVTLQFYFNIYDLKMVDGRNIHTCVE